MTLLDAPHNKTDAEKLVRKFIAKQLISLTLSMTITVFLDRRERRNAS